MELYITINALKIQSQMSSNIHLGQFEFRYQTEINRMRNIIIGGYIWSFQIVKCVLSVTIFVSLNNRRPFDFQKTFQIIIHRTRSPHDHDPVVPVLCGLRL